MRAYIVRRFLLMVPTLFGVTLVTFGIMQLAPGDPLKMQLSSAGAQGESTGTREAFLHQRKQWKLDKPAMLNIRWFQNHRSQARFCAEIYGLPDDELAALLGFLAALAKEVKSNPMLEYLQGLGIEGFDAQLQSEEQRTALVNRVKMAIQIRVEEVLAEHGVKYFAALLDEPGLNLKIGAVRCLLLCTLGNPFQYTYSKDPLEDETEGVVTTWRIWWERAKEKFKPLPAERYAQVETAYRALVAEPSRARILEGMSEFKAEDAPFFMNVLLGNTTLREKYVASIALLYKIGRPLKADVKISDSEKAIQPVIENWKAYVTTRSDRYDPSFLARVAYLFTDTQYANSIVKLVTFDFGRSMVKPYDPVGPKIWRAALVSAPIMLLAEALIYLIAVPSGVYMAVRRGKWQDRMMSLNFFLLYSIPPVVLGMLFLTFFCYGTFLKIFPMYGLHSEGYESWPFMRRAFDYVWHILLPVLCYSIPYFASLAMYSRSSMLDVINQDYIRTARAKGLSGKSVVLRHALRNALIPVITLFSNFIPLILGGSVIIEYLFGIPGMGRLVFESIQAKDINTVMGVIYIDAIVVMLSILLSDLLYVVVDPRISFSKSEGGG